jgi:chemotaxis protein MotB
MKRFHAAVVVLTMSGLVAGCSPSRKDLMAEVDRIRGDFERAEARNSELEQKIAQLERTIAEQAAQIETLGAERGRMQAELEELRQAQKEREAELATYKQLFARLKKLIDAGTIKVVFRKGKMMVAMDSAVLFDSGKSELKDDGKAALDEITAALVTVGDRDFLVAGHTDNVPINRRGMSNWDLSAQRAVKVVNYMISRGFPPEHLGAAGFGEFDPVADNATEDGRSQNRRIEIVLMPNLGELKGIKEMLES